MELHNWSKYETTIKKRDSKMSAGCIARNYTCHIFLSSMFLLVRLLPSAPCITQVFMPWKTRASTFFTSHGSPFCLPSLNPCTHWHITRLTLHRNVYKCHKHHHNHKRKLLQSLFLNSMFFFPPTAGRTLTHHWEARATWRLGLYSTACMENGIERSDKDQRQPLPSSGKLTNKN